MMKRIGLVTILLITAVLIIGILGCATSVKEKNMTALELALLMGNGINLSNTMEAYGHLDPGINKPVEVYETLWQQPVTTQAMINGMKAAGFDSLRIPVAWTNTMDYENGDFTISPAYLNRVEEIVKYAIKADMYVVVNDHWDGGWWGMFGSANQETRNKAMDLYIAMWTRIAEHFKNYSYKLIFESANEELGNRLNDANVAKDSGTLDENSCYGMTIKINQTFVDTVRSTGGKNIDRFLLIAGFDTNIKKTCEPRYAMPKDEVEDRLLISVHYYDPWNYCGTESIARWGSTKEHEDMNKTLARMTQFTEQGYGVIIGEHGPLPLLKDGSYKENLTDYLSNFLANCDLYGYVPMLWDTGGFYNRTEAKITHEDVAALYKEHSLAAQSSLTQNEVKARARQIIEANLKKSEEYVELAPGLDGTGTAMAWLMYASNDWGVTYSVGDQYDPNSITQGVVATDVEITGPGTYTVGLDFTGTSEGFANSAVFSALGISNGEILFPGYIMTIKEVLINGEPYELTGIPYTTTDDKVCTRVNLLNSWVGEIPPEARTMDGDISIISPVVMDNQTLGNVKTIEVTFDYAPGKKHTAMAWIMYASKDWSLTYSVGDEYKPEGATAGIVAKDATITGPGTYTVSLDFTGTDAGAANSAAFSAIGISNGEKLFPGYIITIEEVLINGKPFLLAGRPFTTTDNGVCTRVNLYNEWVSETPPEARTMDGDVSNVSPTVMNVTNLGLVKTIELTFSYAPGPPAPGETAMAWIMYASKDWSLTYSVGDEYKPENATPGIVAKDAAITGPGTYTVSLDFTGTDAGAANSAAFSAIGISNGEKLFPGYIITIEEVFINGKLFLLAGRPFTTTDNGICTRVNLYNEWVSKTPPEARTMDGDVSNVSPTVMNVTNLGAVKTIELTFSYAPGPPAPGETAMAWIMYASKDWSLTYSVGDEYKPEDATPGIVAKDAAITGPGTYTVSLDFTGTDAGAANSAAFSAIGISNGEKLFPGYIITIEEVLINSKPFLLAGRPFTTTDNGICTRVNLYNEWVGKTPPEARTMDGDVSNVSPTVLNVANLGAVKTIELTFSYAPGAPAPGQTAMAWIMYASKDWSLTYSVGDEYKPEGATPGIVAEDAVVTGPGTYTVSLDFTGTDAGAANSAAFSAIGISNGEKLFPGYIITIEEVLINGKPFLLAGRPFTTTDNGVCTRVNLYNEWVGTIPPEARTMDGNVSNVSPTVLNVTNLGAVKTIELTFDYGPVE